MHLELISQAPVCHAFGAPSKHSDKAFGLSFSFWAPWYIPFLLFFSRPIFLFHSSFDMTCSGRPSAGWDNVAVLDT